MSVPLAKSSANAVPGAGNSSPAWMAIFEDWRSNVPFLLAFVTLVGLLIGWLAGDSLPGWLVTIVAVAAYVAGGYNGTLGAWEKLREGELDIDFLMIAAALGAAAIGEWEEGALLLFLFTLSGALEGFAMDRTRHAIEALGQLRPDVASVRRPGGDVILPIDEVQVGDVVIVRPGERLPVDGTVTGGSSNIDQSAITGESVPVGKGVGDHVFAGTINGGGALEVEMMRSAEESTLNKIIRLVAEAREDAAPTQRFIDRFGQPYTYAVIGATLAAIAIPQL
ncbi:MAG: HAD-IC family P-type ATPase, partial [Litorilinea sp.]